MDFKVSAPPVNNALLPDIYNRLDAEIQERTKVVNSLLDKRLLVQEKIINKYRKSVEVIHRKEAVKIRQELSRIRHSLPTVGHVHSLYAGMTERSLQSKKKINPLFLEKRDMPFCERHLIHFLPNKYKFYRPVTPEETSPVQNKLNKYILPSVTATSVVIIDNVLPTNDIQDKIEQKEFNAK